MDPYNPTPDDLREWAQNPDSLEPVQDWNLIIELESENWETILALADDPTISKRQFFLQTLYLIVGDAVRTEFRAFKRTDLDKLIQRSETSNSPEIQNWRERSLHLMKHPDTFDYDEWCDGGLARKAI
jgi:hypothetical protein